MLSDFQNVNQQLVALCRLNFRRKVVLKQSASPHIKRKERKKGKKGKEKAVLTMLRLIDFTTMTPVRCLRNYRISKAWEQNFCNTSKHLLLQQFHIINSFLFFLETKPLALYYQWSILHFRRKSAGEHAVITAVFEIKLEDLLNRKLEPALPSIYKGWKSYGLY